MMGLFGKRNRKERKTRKEKREERHYYRREQLQVNIEHELDDEGINLHESDSELSASMSQHSKTKSSPIMSWMFRLTS